LESDFQSFDRDFEVQKSMIDEDYGKKLGKEVTNQHPLVVFAMAKSTIQIGSGFEMTSLAVTAVRKDGCEISVTLCRGDLCETKKSFYNFNPPLKSIDELNGRMMSDVRSRACTPNPLWLVTDPLALLILIFCGLLAYGTYIGVEDMTDAFVQAPRLERTISAIFGTPRTFSYLICASFWFSIVAHGFEAVVALHYATRSLKLGIGPASLWGIMIFLVGYPIFSRLQELVSIEHKHAKSK